MCGPSKNCPVFVPLGAAWWAYAIRSYDRVRTTLRKTVPFSFPTGPLVGRMRYASTTGYVQSFKIPMLFPNWVRAALRKTVPFSSPSGPRGEAYSIRPYDWVHTILQNTDAISQPDTYGPSKNCLVFVPFGAVCGAYAIRPTDRVCAILRNTDAIPQPDTCDPTKY